MVLLIAYLMGLFGCWMLGYLMYGPIVAADPEPDRLTDAEYFHGVFIISALWPIVLVAYFGVLLYCFITGQ